MRKIDRGRDCERRMLCNPYRLERQARRRAISALYSGSINAFNGGMKHEENENDKANTSNTRSISRRRFRA